MAELVLVEEDQCNYILCLSFSVNLLFCQPNLERLSEFKSFLYSLFVAFCRILSSRCSRCLCLQLHDFFSHFSKFFYFLIL